MQNQRVKTFTMKVPPEEMRERTREMNRLVEGWRGLTDREREVARAFMLTGRKSVPKSLIHKELVKRMARSTVINYVERLEELRLLKAELGMAGKKDGYETVYAPNYLLGQLLGIITDEEYNRLAPQPRPRQGDRAGQ